MNIEAPFYKLTPGNGQPGNGQPVNDRVGYTILGAGIIGSITEVLGKTPHNKTIRAYLLKCLNYKFSHC